jgi:hypothetical protein
MDGLQSGLSDGAYQTGERVPTLGSAVANEKRGVALKLVSY